MPRDIVLGAVLGAHGLKGEVRVKFFTRAAEMLGAYGPLQAADGRMLSVADVRATLSGEAIVRFDAIDSREAAEALKGTGLSVTRDALPDAEADEFYHADLVGLSAEDPLGRHLGMVRSIHNFGAGDVIEIARADGDTVFLPFTREVAQEIDLANKRMVVAAPEEVEAGPHGTVE
jgi:16S rRNA processing protein RimM